MDTLTEKLNEGVKFIEKLLLCVTERASVSVLQYERRSALLLAVIETDSKQADLLQNLLSGVSPHGWVIKTIKTSRKRIPGGWRSEAKIEITKRGRLPRAVQLAREGRPGQEKNPAYPIKSEVDLPSDDDKNSSSHFS